VLKIWLQQEQFVLAGRICGQIGFGPLALKAFKARGTAFLKVLD